MSQPSVIVQVDTLYSGLADPKQVSEYVKNAITKIDGSPNVVLSGGGPPWLYMALASALTSIKDKDESIKSLCYYTTSYGEIKIF